MGRLIQGLVDTSVAGVLLVIFMALFLGIVLWVYRPRARETYEETSRVPLSDDHSA